MGKLNYKSMYTRPVNPDYTGMFDQVRRWQPLTDEQRERVNRYANFMEENDKEAFEHKDDFAKDRHFALTKQQAYDDAYQMEQESNNFLRPTYQRRAFAEPGNINRSDLKVRDYSLPGLFYAAPDAGTLYMDDGVSMKGRTAVPVERDLSNADANASYYADLSEKQNGKIWQAKDGSLSLPPMISDRLSNMKAKRVAGNIASDLNMRSAFTDWMSYLDRNSWANTSYDLKTDPMSQRRDAKIISNAYNEAGGDLRTAFLLAYKDVSYYGKRALDAMIGYFNPSIIPMDDRRNLRMNDAARFFNATRDAEDLASRYYTFDDGRATSEPLFYDPLDPDNAQGSPNGISYDDYMRQSAAADLRLSDRAKEMMRPNSYARGGHLRTPKTIRSSNGIKMHRAEGLGGADYDIYF